MFASSAIIDEANCASIIGSDFYSSYKCFMKEANIKVQFCWAHLIRDIKFLSESSDKVTANYGERLLKLCRLIFHLQHRRDKLSDCVAVLNPSGNEQHVLHRLPAEHSIWRLGAIMIDSDHIRNIFNRIYWLARSNFAKNRKRDLVFCVTFVFERLVEDLSIMH